MIVYHGTTARRAQRICQAGFVPKKPSRRVWFAKSKGYAERRARQQARRARDRAVVLTCDINLSQLRDQVGERRVIYRGGVIAIDALVPPSVLRAHAGAIDQPSSPDELAEWVNLILRLKPYKGVSRRHPGIQRLSRWIVNRANSQPTSRLRPAQILHMARQWLPEFFKEVEIDPLTLHAHRPVGKIDVQPGPAEPETDPREAEALELLENPRPKRRIRGLSLLAELRDPDLFDWCVMHLRDRSVNVRITALHTMLEREEGDSEVIGPLAESENKRVRAAAIAALAKLSEEDAPRWFTRGLKDPEPCVRLETAALLPRLNPEEHHAIFELARNDPNPDVARVALKLTTGGRRSGPA